MTAGESIAAPHPAANAPVRGTQLLVEHMGEVFKRPGLIALEILWRWAVGIPVLWAGWLQVQRILAAYPLANSGWNSIDSENPWVAIVQLAGVWSYYEPPVLAVLRWLVPAAALVWVVFSGVGRNLVLQRLRPGVPFRPFSMMLLQAGSLGLLALTLWAWLASMHWAVATHISVAGEPELVGFFNWAIFLSLGFFALFSLLSWTFSIAPLLMLLERRSVFSALAESLRLGRKFTSKLAEINLVMGIVNLALIVLAMVFSAAPLPFSDEMGTGMLHAVVAGATVFYVLGNDYFQVVRLEAFVEFWKMFRGEPCGEAASS